MPIGLLPVVGYDQRETRMEPGSTLVLYTDGITEAESPDGEEYGIARLSDCAVKNSGCVPEEMAIAINKDLAEFAQDVPYVDDRTPVIVQRLKAD